MTDVFGIVREQFPNSVSFTGMTQHWAVAQCQYTGSKLCQQYPYATRLSLLGSFRIWLVVSLHALCSACACLILSIGPFRTVAQAVTFVCFPSVLTVSSSFCGFPWDFLGVLHPGLFNCLEAMALDSPNQAQIFHCVQM